MKNENKEWKFIIVQIVSTISIIVTLWLTAEEKGEKKGNETATAQFRDSARYNLLLDTRQWLIRERDTEKSEHSILRGNDSVILRILVNQKYKEKEYLTPREKSLEEYYRKIK
jgi:hypothetical protein